MSVWSRQKILRLTAAVDIRAIMEIERLVERRDDSRVAIDALAQQLPSASQSNDPGAICA